MKNLRIEIQRLEIGDIDSLQPLVNEFVMSHPSLNFRDDHWMAFRHWLSKTVNDVVSLCLVARTETMSVGFIVGDIRENVPLLFPEKIGHVSILVVDHSYRSKGIGENLWKKLQSWFESSGVNHFELYTEYGNSNSGPFWQKRGFEVCLEKRRLQSIEN